MPNKNTPFLPSERVWENKGRQVFKVLAPIAPRCQLSLNPCKISQGHFLSLLSQLALKFTYHCVQTLPHAINCSHEQSPIKGLGLLQTFKSGSLCWEEEYPACLSLTHPFSHAQLSSFLGKASLSLWAGGGREGVERRGLWKGWNEMWPRSSSGWDC